MTSDDDAPHGARAVLGGRRLNLSTAEVFSRLNGLPRISSKELRTAQREFDAMRIGIAVEAVERAVDRQTRLAALLSLARTLGPHLKDRLPGWFRFILEWGSQRGESMFRLSCERRPHSSTAQPRAVLDRATQTVRALNNMVVAGAILRRIETAKGNGRNLTLRAAIEAAIIEGDIATDEEAARAAWRGFRRDCDKLTQASGTYRLEKYAGPITKYHGRWVALPDTGMGVSKIPSAKGGRPKT